MASRKPRKLVLEERIKGLDIVEKIGKIRTDKVKNDQEEEKRELEIEEQTLKNEALRGNSSFIMDLLVCCIMPIIDESTTLIGSEPKYKLLFNDRDRAIIKKKIMDKIQKL